MTSPPSHADLLRWSEALSGIARTGLGFTESLYERERFVEELADGRVIPGGAAAGTSGPPRTRSGTPTPSRWSG